MKTRKLTLIILLFIAATIMFSALSISNATTTTAETDELGYLKITRNRTVARTVELGPENSDTVTYRHQIKNDGTRNVWKLVTCEANSTTNKVTKVTNTVPDLYCLRAGLGFMASDVEDKAVYYNRGIDMTEYVDLVNTFNGNHKPEGITSDVTLFDEENIGEYYAVLWILDNMLLEVNPDYIPVDKDFITVGEEKIFIGQDLIKYLTTYAGYSKADIERAFTNKTPEILTRADIEAIQQLAIWYFTNNDEAAYHPTSGSLPTLYISIDGDAVYYTINTEEQINSGLLGQDEEGNYIYKAMTDAYTTKDKDNPETEIKYGITRQAHANTLFQNLIKNMNKAVGETAGTYNEYKPKNREITVWLAKENFTQEQPVVQVKEKEKYADIALRKFISKIERNGNDIELGVSRAPQVDTSKLNTIVGGKPQTTAIYNHPKNPVSVEIGDKITYTLRLYNEGNVDAYVTQVTDHLPAYLYAETDAALGWNVPEEQGGFAAITNQYCKVVGSNFISEEEINAGVFLGDRPIPAAVYNKESKDYTLSYIDIEIKCTVGKTGDNVPEEVNLTNIAEVTEMFDTELDDDGEKIPLQDRDSQVDGGYVSEDGGLADIPPDPNTDTSKNVTIDPNYNGGPDPIPNDKYIPGQQDDDDFEKVVIKSKFDMALRKFITKIERDGKNVELEVSRVPEVDIKGFNGDTTAFYNHTKDPVKVKVGDIVTYTIRLYNEGEVAGKVREVTDYIAKYLKYVPSETEKATNEWWKPDYTGIDCYTLTTTPNCVVTDVGGNTNTAYKGMLLTDAVIPAYDGTTVSYVDIEVKCEVMPVFVKTNITNIAEITEELKVVPVLNPDGSDKIGEDGRPVYEEIPVKSDRDSTPDNLNVPLEKDFPGYPGGKDPIGDYVPGQQDDDDFEKLYIEPYFDLALRKFITAVGNVSVNDRYPEIKYDPDTEKKFTYEHKKTPVPVATNDIVTYTIRIYNEGQADGWANEITDDLPEGIEFLPDNELNKEYRWTMLDSNQKPTTDVKKAKYIITDYLSEEQEKATGRNNKLLAFDMNKAITDKTEDTIANPDYRDVKVAFKVTYVPTTKEEASRIIINEAQISKDSDDDIDSEPNRDELYDYDPDGKNEDDIDYDNIIVKYFDLALLKWVSETHVTLNGKTTVYDAGNSEANAHNENIPQLVLSTSDINKVTVKYLYTIKVMNEGELDGYATELKDHIPEGLRFDKDDEINKKYGWSETSDGKVTTNYLKDTLLKAGQDDNVTVQIMFTWINGKENLGSKINYAEISEDDNPGDVPDIDSTPDNFKDKPKEDDEDDAEVIITIKTGSAPLYIGLSMAVLVLFGSGIVLIKKYVL